MIINMINSARSLTLKNPAKDVFNTLLYNRPLALPENINLSATVLLLLLQISLLLTLTKILM